ncbi:putative nucleotidyltransferase with HDIG domain [Rhizobium sp. BK313]|jgi:putative nucleotidyltransferase with HDIG domain|uniref:HDIG domain-containing metalloprotein n=1 Tax=Rhizobium sp. BK313 TaxID=2587081 RepID=UPI00105DA584|nr:HDIG domain-containing metalloprotein [Rhizobium sp. BK313]MBB3457251.1 putative nucleotidyltransferase with HDIG domain [Rhizobium sp. BK313]
MEQTKSKTANAPLGARPQRPITDELRERVRRELPEIAEIKNEDLRAKVVEAWAFSLAGSSYDSLIDMPACGVPGIFEAKSGNQTDHLRAVTRQAILVADDFIRNFPQLEIDRDLVVAGALCHDIGKPWEFDPVNRERWASSRHTGRPAIRHPAYGVYICLSVGLPEEVAHVAAAHSAEGNMVARSIENSIIHAVDEAYWQVMTAGNQVNPETIPAAFRRP